MKRNSLTISPAHQRRPKALVIVSTQQHIICKFEYRKAIKPPIHTKYVFLFPFHSGLTPHISSSATDVCFARQHNVSDNNNQCFSSANGHLPNGTAAQRPGAIDNQPLVTTEPMKVSVHVLLAFRILLSIKLTARERLVHVKGK